MEKSNSMILQFLDLGFGREIQFCGFEIHFGRFAFQFDFQSSLSIPVGFLNKTLAEKFNTLA